MFFSHSSLKSQLYSLAGSSIKLPFEFHSGAAIPPKKLFGSSLLCIITRVEPKKLNQTKLENTFVITIIVKCLTIKSKHLIK